MAKGKNVATRETEHVDEETGEVIRQLPALIFDDRTEIGAPVKIIKKVTIPTLTFPDGATLICRFETVIREGRELVQGRRGPPKMKPADVAVIYHPKAGARQLVTGTVLKNELEAAYPNGGFVGKWFLISKFAPKAEKVEEFRKSGMTAYSTYSIDEIENPTV